MNRHRQYVSLLRIAGHVVFAAVWGLALLLGLGHALHHQDGSCSLCITISTQAKSVEMPQAPNTFAPLIAESLLRWPLVTAPASVCIPSSERLRAPPAAT